MMAKKFCRGHTSLTHGQFHILCYLISKSCVSSLRNVIAKKPGRGNPAEKPSESRLDELQRHKIKAAVEGFGVFLADVLIFLK